MREQYLTPINVNRVEKYVQPNGRVQSIKYIDCICKCGNKITVRQGQVKTSSCGCKRTVQNKSRVIDLTGQRFGRLTAIEYLGNSRWLCKCDCGNEVTPKTAALNNSNSKSCGCLQKEKASSSMTNFIENYRVERGFDKDEILSSIDKIDRVVFTKQVSPKILERDNWTCQLCLNKGGLLNVHHITKWSENISLRYDPMNLITLCRECHMKAHDGNTKSEVNQEIKIILENVLAARRPISALGT